ncbi:MAG: hypothetical protein COA75_01360 [Cellvibrionales bacterium]|nr:MAG: hypothetical protein COA75_01360 [Cellvibrionales bacterium]
MLVCNNIMNVKILSTQKSTRLTIDFAKGIRKLFFGLNVSEQKVIMTVMNVAAYPKVNLTPVIISRALLIKLYSNG